MKYNLLFVFLLLSQWSFAQSECNCQRNFDEMYQKIKDNYAGYDLKVNATTKPKFDALTKKVKDKSKNITDPKACFDTLKEWTEFFKDGHLFINTQSSLDLSDSPETIKERATKISSQKFISEAGFQTHLNANLAKLEQIEGIWESNDKSYRVGIVKDEATPNKFIGFIFTKRDANWIPGKNKFELEKIADNKYNTKYYFSDFSTEIVLSRQIKNILVIENIIKFQKVSPMPKDFVNQYEIDHQVADYRVEKVDSSTALIVLPPFTIPNAPEYIKQLVLQNDGLIRSSKNLIIDFRNNNGGDEHAFDAIFPYIADGPIVRKGSKIRASQENLILLNHELKSIQDFPQYRQTLDPKLREIVRKMQANMGRMFDGPDKTYNFPANSLNPQKVVILVNKKTASSAESLCLEAKQSKKVILMGTNTRGLADFTEVRDWGLPCYGWRLAFGLGMSHRLPLKPIENIGIKPDVAIAEKETDWVNAALKYLNTAN
jgi:hypothetical protein